MDKERLNADLLDARIRYAKQYETPDTFNPRSSDWIDFHLPHSMRIAQGIASDHGVSNIFMVNAIAQYLCSYSDITVSEIVETSANIASEQAQASGVSK